MLVGAQRSAWVKEQAGHLTVLHLPKQHQPMHARDIEMRLILAKETRIDKAWQFR